MRLTKYKYINGLHVREIYKLESLVACRNSKL